MVSSLRPKSVIKVEGAGHSGPLFRSDNAADRLGGTPLWAEVIGLYLCVTRRLFRPQTARLAPRRAAECSPAALRHYCGAQLGICLNRFAACDRRDKRQHSCKVIDMFSSKTRVSELLGIEHPVIQAPMVWLTSAGLVAAVSEAGGMGVLGPNAGQTTKTTDPAETAKRFRNEIRKTRSLTSRPFAVNFLLPIDGVDISYRYAEPLLQVILEEKVGVVITVGQDIGKGLTYIRMLNEAGVIVIHRELSPTVENALEAEKAGVDAFIVTGHEAGGHLSEHRISTLVLLPQITDALSIPVIAAGGIYNAKTAAAARAAGAEGVYAGTRFIMTHESPAAAAAKQAILKVRSQDLIEVGTPGAMARIIAPKPGAGATQSDGISATKTGMLDGDLDNGIVCVSESAGGIANIVSAREIVLELARPFRDAPATHGPATQEHLAECAG